MSSRRAIAYLLSGRGTNLQAMLAAGVPVGLVVSDVAGVRGLEKARAARVPTAVLEPAAFAGKQDYDEALGDVIAAYRPALVVMGGFMRVLGAGIVERFAGRMVSIHPSLLPQLPGLDTHRRALAEGHAEHGCSVHWVTEKLDGGPVIAQSRVPVRAGDDEQSLARRVLAAEHKLYPQTVAAILAGIIKP